MQISIIIPIYNVAPYIEKCLQSVADQTFHGTMECLLIDDCGQDESMALAEHFVSAYKGNIVFRIFHHERNRGLSAARNTGIENACGEWLYFLDSDDWIVPECIQWMMECVEKHPDTELVHAGTKATWGHEYMSLVGRRLPEYANNPDWISPMILRTWVTAWNNLLRRSYVEKNNLRFEEGIKSEDEVWTFDLSLHAPVLAFLLKDTYVYRWRDNSISTAVCDMDMLMRRRCIVWQNEIERLRCRNGYRRWHVKKIWKHVFQFYDGQINRMTKWRIRLNLWKLAIKADFDLAIAILMSSTLTNTKIDIIMYRYYYGSRMEWNCITADPVIGK